MSLAANPDEDWHGWAHVQCLACWQHENGADTKPWRATRPPLERCCFCGRHTRDGIHRRRVAPTDDRIPFCPDRTRTHQEIP